MLKKMCVYLMANQIVSFFEDNGLFSECQHGFRKGHYTLSAFLEFIIYILEDYENKEFFSASFCDLPRALDYVSHQLLIEK